MDNKKLIIGGVAIFILVIVVLVAGASYFFVSGNVDLPGTKEPKYWHECNVKIDEAWLGKSVSIESASCENTGKKCGSIFGFFSAEGTLELWDSTGRLASKDYATDWLSGKDTITIRGCTSESGITLKLYDEDHNLKDTQTR